MRAWPGGWSWSAPRRDTARRSCWRTGPGEQASLVHSTRRGRDDHRWLVDLVAAGGGTRSKRLRVQRHLRGATLAAARTAWGGTSWCWCGAPRAAPDATARPASRPWPRVTTGSPVRLLPGTLIGTLVPRCPVEDSTWHVHFRVTSGAGWLPSVQRTPTHPTHREEKNGRSQARPGQGRRLRRHDQHTRGAGDPPSRPVRDRHQLFGRHVHDPAPVRARAGSRQLRDPGRDCRGR